MRAKEALAKYGQENVINGTIGSLYREDEKIATYGVVEEVFRNLPSEDLFAYSSHFTGEKDFLLAIRKNILGKNYEKDYPEIFMDGVATPGGTGAISSTIKNYLNEGEKVLLPNWMWGSYRNIVKEFGGIDLTYNLFNEELNFDIINFKKQVLELAKEQENLIVVINDPSHNPTGMRLSYEEWKEIFAIFTEAAKSCNIILIKDIAYFEYDNRSEEETNKIHSLMKTMPMNMLIVYTFSLSKSMTMYGLRIGAQLGISRDKKVIEEFYDAVAYSCRVTWSNSCKGAMKTYTKIMSDSSLRARYEEEKKDLVELLFERAEIFLSEAEECKLETLPYKSGFFVTIPLGKKVEEIIVELEKQNIFVIKFNDGIRLGICSIPTTKLKGLAKKIKEIKDVFYLNDNKAC